MKKQTAFSIQTKKGHPARPGTYSKKKRHQDPMNIVDALRAKSAKNRKRILNVRLNQNKKKKGKKGDHEVNEWIDKGLGIEGETYGASSKNKSKLSAYQGK